MARRRRNYFTSPRVKRRRTLARGERELEGPPKKTMFEQVREWEEAIYKAMAIPKEYLGR